MSNQENPLSQIEDLLEMLRCCAHNLLLAYDQTLSTELWTAFEITAEVCESLTYQQQLPLFFH